jgi:hypothetical protein
MSRSGSVLWHVGGRWVSELTSAGVFPNSDAAKNAIGLADPTTPDTYMLVKIVRGTPPERWMELPDSEVIVMGWEHANRKAV